MDNLNDSTFGKRWGCFKRCRLRGVMVNAFLAYTFPSCHVCVFVPARVLAYDMSLVGYN